MIKRLAVWIAVLLCVLGTAVPMMAQSDNEVPEDYRKLPDLHIFTDERMGQWAGSGNGMILETVGEGGQAGLPIDEKETYNELPSYRVQVSEQNGWWSFILAGKDWESYSIALPFTGSTAKSRDRQKPQQIGTERRQIRTNLGLNQRFFGHNKAKAGGPKWFNFFSRLSVDLPLYTIV